MNGWIEAPPQKQRPSGCLGRGCIILSSFLLLLLIACAIGIYYGMRKHSAVMHAVVWARKAHVLASEPSPVPQYETTAENIAAVKRKWSDFKSAATSAEQSTATQETTSTSEPVRASVEFTADELNNLIAANKRARGKAFVTIEGNRLHLQVSVPMREYVGQAGYFLNGDIVVQANGPESPRDPPLSNITVNGEPLPQNALDWTYAGRTLRDYIGTNRDISSIDAVEIRDGKLILEKR